MENKLIELDGVPMPYITNDDGVEYYPVKYMFEKILNKAASQLHKNEKYKMYVERYIIDFSVKGTSPQECYCMSKDGWFIYFKNCKMNKNKTDEKVSRLKILADYFNTEIKQVNKDYDRYTLDCIKQYKMKRPDIPNKKCIGCERELPACSYFYNKDNRSFNGIINTCRQCNGYNWINDNEQNKYIYDTYGLEGYEKYLYDKVQFYIQHLMSNNNMKLKIKKEEYQCELLLEIMKKMYDDGILNKDQLAYNFFINKYNIETKGLNVVTNQIINEYCSNGDCVLHPWNYKNYKVDYEIDIENAKKIFTRYIEDKNIVDIFTYNNFANDVIKARLRKYSSNSLRFIVEYYNFKYAGYKFKIPSVNYYKEKEMRIFDMKWFIEKDLKIPIHKIPLYVTKYSLNQKARPLYHIINKYYDSLFEWIDECYPGEFNINDFEVNPYRAEFDSLEEAQVDETLRNNFENVLYNSRNTKYTVSILGMQPDWMIITDNGCWLVEYFGLYSKNTDTSHRLQRYEDKLKIKIEKYKELEKIGYKILHIYPDDLKDNNDKLIKKINNIK